MSKDSFSFLSASILLLLSFILFKDLDQDVIYIVLKESIQRAHIIIIIRKVNIKYPPWRWTYVLYVSKETFPNFNFDLFINSKGFSVTLLKLVVLWL